jgi:hypothetical protein
MGVGIMILVLEDVFQNVRLVMEQERNGIFLTVTDTRSFNTKIYKEMKKSKLKTKVSDMAEEKLRVSDVRQRLYITKTRWGVYEVLNEQQYERKLIYG